MKAKIIRFRPQGCEAPSEDMELSAITPTRLDELVRGTNAIHMDVEDLKKLRRRVEDAWRKQAGANLVIEMALRLGVKLD